MSQQNLRELRELIELRENDPKAYKKLLKNIGEVMKDLNKVIEEAIG